MFPIDLITLPREHPLLAAVDSSDIALRRFDPDNSNVRDFVTRDEGSAPRLRLKGGALTGFSSDGCSTARDQVLSEAQIARREVLEPKYRRIAEASVDAIRSFQLVRDSGDTVTPFEVVPDPYPDDEPSPKKWMVAHALITIVPLTKAEKTTAVGALARTVFNPLDPETLAGDTPESE